MLYLKVLLSGDKQWVLLGTKSNQVYFLDELLHLG